VHGCIIPWFGNICSVDSQVNIDLKNLLDKYTMSERAVDAPGSNGMTLSDLIRERGPLLSIL